MEIHEIIISAFVTIFSADLLIVSLASYKKYKNLKLLFVSVVFLVFLIKEVFLGFITSFQWSFRLIGTHPPLYGGLEEIIYE